MDTRVRIRTIRLIEKIERAPKVADSIGLSVVSKGGIYNEQNDENIDGNFNNSICCSTGSNTGTSR